MARVLAEMIADDILKSHDFQTFKGIPENVGAAYDVQDEVVPLLGPTCGRKIAMNAPMLMDRAGINEPIAGHILGDRALKSGVELSVSDFGQLAIEPEFAAVLKQDLLAGTEVSADELLPYIARFSMAFEVLDRRHDTGVLHAPTYIAHNVFNAGVVLDDTPLDTTQMLNGQLDIQFSANGSPIVSGTNTAPQNPLDACAFVVNLFTLRGQTVRAGEVILCGAHYPPLIVDAGTKYDFSVSDGPAVSLSISS